MRALIIDGPERFGFSEIAAPVAGPGEVLVDVLCGGICGTDVEIIHGDMVYFTTGMALYPVVPCHEWTGVVADVGRDVEGFALGDHVVGEVSIGCRACGVCLSGNYHRCSFRTETGILGRQGAFAEQIALPAAFLHRISPDVPLGSAALVEPSAVAFNGVLRAGVSPRDYVAIFGDGPIGLLILQIVKIFGASRVLLVGAADRRLQLARKLGADEVIDVRSGDLYRRVRENWRGTLPDVVFEASGSPDAIKAAITLTAPGGRLILQGFCGSRHVRDLNTDSIIVNDLTVIGVLGSPGVWSNVIRLIECGRFNPSEIVTDELPVSAFREAIRRVESREAVKVVLRTDAEAAWK
jgi:L-iditol 2-dehydrogenase